MKKLLFLLKTLICLASFGFMTNLHAQTYTVDTTNDTVDDNLTDGVCSDISGNCSLRAAIMQANATAGIQTVSIPAGTYTLSIGGTTEDAAATGDLDITGEIIIEGENARTTIIDANRIDRVFHNPLGSNVAITYRNLTITGGDGIVAVGVGGGINHNATGLLTIDNCTISGNDGNFGGGGLDVSGNGTVVTITNSTITNNQALNFGLGGGMSVGTITTLNITNSTISGNRTNLGFAGSAGAGIYSQAATNNFTHCTITNNQSLGIGDIGGGIVVNGGTLNITHSIVAANSASSNADIYLNGGSINSTGYNIIGDNSSTGLTAGSPNGGNDYVGTLGTPFNAQLNALANNGGQTDTHSFANGANPHNTGNAATTSTDQRGGAFLRAVNGVDIGAFEFVASDIVDPINETVTVTTVADGGAIAYGSTGTGSPVLRTFQVTNNGSGVLNVTMPTVPSGYTVTTGGFPLTAAAAGGTLSFTIRLDAVGAGTYNGTVTFQNSDFVPLSVQEYSFSVSGTVTAGPCIAFTAPAGVTNTWLGCTNTDWSTASNWSTGSVPSVTDIVYIPVVASQLVIDEVATCAKMFIEIGAKCQIDYNAGGKLVIKF